MSYMSYSDSQLSYHLLWDTLYLRNNNYVFLFIDNLKKEMFDDCAKCSTEENYDFTNCSQYIKHVHDEFTKCADLKPRFNPSDSKQHYWYWENFLISLGNYSSFSV